MEEENPLELHQMPEKRFHWVAFAIAFTALIVILYEVVGSSVVFLLPGGQHSPWMSIVNGLAQVGFMLIPVLLVSSYSPLRFSQIFRLEKAPTFMQTILAVVGIITFQMFVTGYESLQQALIPQSLKSLYESVGKYIEGTYQVLLGGKGPFALARALIVGALIPAVCEESLFRGFCQRQLEERIKPWKAMLITSVFFGLVHFNPIDLIPLISIGFYLGFLAYWSQSLLLPILIHFINNALAIAVLYNSQPQKIIQNPETMPLLPAFLLCILGFGLTYIAMRFIYLESKRASLI